LPRAAARTWWRARSPRSSGAALGQTIIVDNKPGASGVIAMEAAAKSAPDGYTLVLGSASTVVVNPAVLPDLPYDPVKDFEHLGDVGSGSVVLVAHPDFPVKDLRDVIALAKAKPGELNYGTWGNGSTGHICAEMVRAATGIQMTHVPLQGRGTCVERHCRRTHQARLRRRTVRRADGQVGQGQGGGLLRPSLDQLPRMCRVTWSKACRLTSSGATT
jgi:tripartite-type tricarboxylate transporter receptor subunit TctC